MTDKLSENALKLYEKLYYAEGENSPSETHKRISLFIGKDDKEFENKIFEALESKAFRPNTPVFLNAGLMDEPQSSACFISDLQDNLESILDFDREAAVIYSRGSGIGANYGMLREVGAEISGGGKSSGSFAFMRKSAATAECVKSGGRSRRSAHLAMFMDNHPDIEEFITIKNGIHTDLRSMNLSIATTDKFMNAVDKDLDWDLIGVKDKKIKKTLKARDLYNKIVDNAYRTGDPAPWFIDRVNEDNGLIDYKKVVCCNPCFQEDTLIETSKGSFKIIDLVGKNVQVFDGKDWVLCDNFRKTGKDQKLIKFTMQDNSTLNVTPYHNMYLNDNENIKAMDVSVGNVLEISNVIKNNNIGYNIIKNIEHIEGLHDVYCCTIPTTHKILTSSGIITGQCGEISGIPYTMCNLGHINLNNCLSNGVFDFDKLKYYSKLITEFLDKTITLSGYPTEKYNKAAQDSRIIGLGIMGLADILIKLNLRYDSQEAIDLSGKIARFMTKFSIIKSSEIAQKFGSFPLYKDHKENMLKVASKFFDLNDENEIQEFELVKKYGLRNSQWTTFAPTGSTSISADCSPSLEPNFAICYKKHLSDSNEEWYFVNNEFKKRYENEKWYDKAIKDISKHKGSCQGLSYIPKEIRDIFITAHDIKWQDRIKMQASLQNGISNSISSTINLPSDAPRQDVYDIYMSAWKQRLKGVTVYLDDSLGGQPIEFGDSDKDEKENECFVPKLFKRELLDVERSFRHRVSWKKSKVYLNISVDNDNMPIEVFTKLPREVGINGDGNFNPTIFNERLSNWNLISRLMSMCLRYGISIEEITSQCDKSSMSMIDASGIMSRVLKKYIKNESNEDGEDIGSKCPECKQMTYIFEGGCKTCKSCGYSKCG